MNAASTSGVIELPEDKARAFVESFDLTRLTRDFLDDPFPRYHALRRFAPVKRLPDGSVFLSRYADIQLCYRDARMSSDKKVEFGPKFGVGTPLYRHHTTSLVFNDPPLHTRVRRLLAAAFTPRALKALEPRVAAIVDQLLDQAADARRMDVIEDFGFALPVEVICDMLGVPRAERGPFRRYSLAILGALEPVISAEKQRIGDDAVAEFSAYLDDLISARRKRPADDNDVLGTLIHGEVDGERLTHEELVQNCIFLLNAGHETTTNLIGNTLDALLRFPDQLARLQADPTLIRSCVEEGLRFESSNQLGNRRLMADAEIGGERLAAGTYIHIGIGAANRDPAEFPEPDRFDAGRTPNRHVAFGAGVHMCLGATLARMEGTIALDRFIRRFPACRRDGDFVRGGRARFRGFAKYPVAW
ncbi:cytochrome P450 [Vineibacter terrae]|uniref:Cytochrome P450 n=1 Tax=Vineibacter terrae TaxID=2586908 RepID=A0A5C8PJ00_9HYPH|nr:cytochrome P450 [Vineibacter terrae]TXL73667.1 cytochrome P450 [Vineibacter terrae]